MKSFRWDKNTIFSAPDHTGAEIVVNGRVWRFDFCRQLGPLWLKKDGSPRHCQIPQKPVWDAFEHWIIEHELNTKNTTE
jgi:hypothetical protein